MTIWFYGMLASLLVFGSGISCRSLQNEKTPKNAIILFDGKTTDQWVHRDTNKPCGWVIKDAAMEGKGGDIVTRQKFRDFQLHVEFWLPHPADTATGQARANSGVYLQGRYEIQILDSYGLKEAGKGDCAAIYGQKAPDKNVAKPTGEWQTYDITFRAPHFNNNTGKMTEKACVTVLWNGAKVHDSVDIDDFTRASIVDNPQTPGPILLQYHGCPVRFRNIWIVPAK